MLYRNFATQEELDAQQDLENTIEDISLYTDFYVRESEKVRAELDHHLDVPFGPTLAEHVDLYPAPGSEHPTPVPIYLHSGYWRSRTSKEFSFVARGPASVRRHGRGQLRSLPRGDKLRDRTSDPGRPGVDLR